MQRGKFNAMNEVFGQLAFQRRFIEEHPECEDCEHVQELIFDGRVYMNIVKKQYCPTCTHYTGV